MTRFLAALSIAATVGGLALALTGAGLLPGVLLLLFGLALGAALGAIAAARSVRNSIGEWRSVFSAGGPAAVHVLAVEPPRGFILNRDATVTLEIRGQDGTTKQVDRSIPVPPIQAFLWRVVGRVPTPFGRLTDRRELNLAIYRRKPQR